MDTTINQILCNKHLLVAKNCYNTIHMIVPMRGSEKNVAELIQNHIISNYS